MIKESVREQVVERNKADRPMMCPQHFALYDGGIGVIGGGSDMVAAVVVVAVVAVGVVVVVVSYLPG